MPTTITKSSIHGENPYTKSLKRKKLICNIPPELMAYMKGQPVVTDNYPELCKPLIVGQLTSQLLELIKLIWFPTRDFYSTRKILIKPKFKPLAKIVVSELSPPTKGFVAKPKPYPTECERFDATVFEP